MNNKFKMFRNIILLIILAIFIRMILMFGYILYLPSIIKFGDYIDSSTKYIPNFRREYEKDFNLIVSILDKTYEDNSEERLFYIDEDGSIWCVYIRKQRTI